MHVENGYSWVREVYILIIGNAWRVVLLQKILIEMSIWAGQPPRSLSENREPTAEKSILARFPDHFR